MAERFVDHFASVARHYADFRPRYSPAIFDWLVTQCESRECAWDCGAGSGQAAVELARRFSNVIATDASAGQLSEAIARPNLRYVVAHAESPGLADTSVDLVVAAQALHWFDLSRFYPEVRRILKPSGRIAAWCYGRLSIADAKVDATVQHFYHDIIGPYWPPERRHLESGYADLPFPFVPVEAPSFTLEAHWTMPQLLGYLSSWSATVAYIRALGHDPVANLGERLGPDWGDPSRPRLVRWPLSLRVGRVHASQA